MSAGGTTQVAVVLVEDHPLYRFALEQVVERDPALRLVGSFADGDETLAAIERLKPDVALVDLSLPGLDGLGIIRAVTERQLPTRTVVLSGNCDGSAVYAALGAGAAGYLTKDIDQRDVCGAIMAAARGETVLSPELKGGIADAIRRHVIADEPALTQREREVLNLAARGYSGPQMGRELYVSPTTVKKHLSSSYDKLGVSDRAAAVARAMKLGLL